MLSFVSFLHKPATLGIPAREMLKRLRMRYSLYYALPSCRPGEWRTIQVNLTAEAAAGYAGTIVRARTGYFAPL